MFGWLRNVFARLSLVTVRPALRPLPSSAAKLASTERHHDETLRKADGLLEDFRRFDGALRVVTTKR